MSESKRIMARKLYNVQRVLMDMEIQDFSLESLTSLIFNECSKENLCFWFNFIEETCVLNLRDIHHENYELNTRVHYDNALFNGISVDDLKVMAFKNTFLLTENKVLLENNEASSENITKEETSDAKIISGDKVTPIPIRKAIEKIKGKGIDVTKEAIKNHVPWSQLSTDQMIKCTNYLNQMEASV
ncbi:MAG: hypothetical protein J6M91_04625 [Methanobrevibacter sp.]|nr:hypothetical protein [Methanobrevibacter sp.]